MGICLKITMNLKIWVYMKFSFLSSYVNFIKSFLDFNYRTLSQIFNVFQVKNHIVEQMYSIGVGTTPIILITSFFIGAVTAGTAAMQFADLIPLSFVGIAVGKSVATELGPVLTALVFAGRVGSSIAATIGHMKINEQLDAYDILNLNIFKFLFLPRIIATTLMLPILVIISDFIAILGALLVAVYALDIDALSFMVKIRGNLIPFDIYFGMIKGIVFGYLVGIVSLYYGYKTLGGARGVSIATKTSVVRVSVLVLISDAIIWIVGR